MCKLGQTLILRDEANGLLGKGFSTYDNICNNIDKQFVNCTHIKKMDHEENERGESCFEILLLFAIPRMSFFQNLLMMTYFANHIALSDSVYCYFVLVKMLNIFSKYFTSILKPSKEDVINSYKQDMMKIAYARKSYGVYNILKSEGYEVSGYTKLYFKAVNKIFYQ